MRQRGLKMSAGGSRFIVIGVLSALLLLEGCVWQRQAVTAPAGARSAAPARLHPTGPLTGRPLTGPPPHAFSLGQFLVIPHRPAGRLNYLIAGVTPEYSGYHQRAPENFTGLTDSMILAQLDPETNTVRMLSLPRDTRVRLGDLGVHKLNAAIALQGTDGMQTAVETLTGLKLAGYLLINLNAACDLTDAVGGVEVYVPEAMNYDDAAANLHIHFQPGLRRLTGREAAAYIRFRHDALGDIGRVKRQQAYLRALSRELFTPGVLLHLPALSNILAQDTRTDADQHDVSAALGLLLARPRLETYLYPGHFLTEDGVSYWSPDQAAAQTLLSGQFGLSAAGQDARGRATTATSLRVVNLGASSEVARGVLQALRQAGERDVQLVQGTGGDPAHTVLLSQGDPAALGRIQRELGYGESRVSGEGVLDADVTIWLGSDAHVPGPPSP